MLEVDHVRHSGIFLVKDMDVTLIGAGGIGAITAITLVKMGFTSIGLFDAENVEEENVATQFHTYSSIGSPKALAVAHQCRLHDPSAIVSPMGYCNEDKKLRSHFIVCTVDSIASRKMVWESAKKGRWLYYIDARMGAEILQIYSVYEEEIGWYDSRLNALNEDDIPELPCTEKATIYTGMGAAAFIGNTMKKFLMGEDVPRFQQMDFANATYITSGFDTTPGIS